MFVEMFELLKWKCNLKTHFFNRMLTCVEPLTVYSLTMDTVKSSVITTFSGLQCEIKYSGISVSLTYYSAPNGIQIYL